MKWIIGIEDQERRLSGNPSIQFAGPFEGPENAKEILKNQGWVRGHVENCFLKIVEVEDCAITYEARIHPFPEPGDIEIELPG